MLFTTPVPVQKSNFPIDYDSDVFSVGSCFAVNMAEKLAYFGFNGAVNPFGILFHPVAIQKFAGLAAGGIQFTEADVFFHEERWHCFDAHSGLSHPERAILLESLNEALAAAHRRIHLATHFVITLGTAWVYRNAKSGQLVANCHKVPQKEFVKELLPAAEVTASVLDLVRILSGANPQAQIIFTISPVRHIKDGFVENQLGKSHLISGLHAALAAHPANTHYFPSYEIVTDELRDYRFYTADMLHPNQVAIDYIWEKFSVAWISAETKTLSAEVASIRKALSHRSFNPHSEQHQKFLSSLDARIENVRKLLPHLGLQ